MNEKKKRKTPRYYMYYKATMQPVWEEEWNTYERRIRRLKKDVLSLGVIPTNENQLIKTVNYFVRLVNLVTNFNDNGIVIHAPTSKAEEAYTFNEIIVSIMARKKGIAQYHNKSEFGKPVTYENLYLGMFSKVDPEDVSPEMQTVIINDDLHKVDVESTSISDWINNRAFSLDGRRCHIKQKDLATVDTQLTSILMKAINDVLSD